MRNVCQCGEPIPPLGGTRSLSAGPGAADPADIAGVAGLERLPEERAALGRSRFESVVPQSSQDVRRRCIFGCLSEKSRDHLFSCYLN